MRSIERLLIQLNAAYGGPAWHGPSLGELLDGVTEEEAPARPIAQAPPLLEIVVHVRAWMDAVSERLAGSPRELTTEEDWSDVARTSWPAVLEELDHAESRVCDAAGRLLRRGGAPAAGGSRHACRRQALQRLRACTRAHPAQPLPCWADRAIEEGGLSRKGLHPAPRSHTHNKQRSREKAISRQRECAKQPAPAMGQRSCRT